jgi:hypothetical protein
MLTLFAAPKPFVGHIGIIQRNALQSWLQIAPGVEVILFGDGQGIAEVAAEFDLAHVTNVECNEYGTPFVNSLFSHAQQMARCPLLCYANADIIFLDDFAPALRRVAAAHQAFLAVGERWDADVTEPLDFGPGWQTRLRTLALSQGRAHGVGGIDFFVFPRGQSTDMPPLLVGRPWWDNWMLLDAHRRRIPVVDLTPAALVIHQNHDYAHIKVRTGPKYLGPEAAYNQSMVHPFTYVYTLDATDKLVEPHGIRPARRWRHRRQRANAWFSLRFPSTRTRIAALLKAASGAVGAGGRQ